LPLYPIFWVEGKYDARRCSGIISEGSSRLGKVDPSQNDIILRIAQLLADSGSRILKVNFDGLVYIGAVRYQEDLGQFRARSELASMMKTLIDKSKNNAIH